MLDDDILEESERTELSEMGSGSISVQELFDNEGTGPDLVEEDGTQEDEVQHHTLVLLPHLR